MIRFARFNYYEFYINSLNQF